MAGRADSGALRRLPVTACRKVYAFGACERRCDRAEGHDGPCSGDFDRRREVAAAHVPRCLAHVRNCIASATGGQADAFGAACAAYMAGSWARDAVRFARSAGMLEASEA